MRVGSYLAVLFLMEFMSNICIVGDPRALYIWVRAWMNKLFAKKIRLKFIRDPPGKLVTIKDAARTKRRDESKKKLKLIQEGIYDPNTCQVLEDSSAGKLVVDLMATFPLARPTLVR
jgi:hypothetical protein